MRIYITLNKWGSKVILSGRRYSIYLSRDKMTIILATFYNSFLYQIIFVFCFRPQARAGFKYVFVFVFVFKYANIRICICICIWKNIKLVYLYLYFNNVFERIWKILFKYSSSFERISEELNIGSVAWSLLPTKNWIMTHSYCDVKIPISAWIYNTNDWDELPCSNLFYLIYSCFKFFSAWFSKFKFLDIYC